MGRGHAKSKPAGVLIRPYPRRIKLPKGKSVMDMFHTDTLRGILWLDDRAGLSVVGAACLLMSYRMAKRGYKTARVPAQTLVKIKRSPAFRRSKAKGLAA